jgi:hypothetical protein
MLSTTDADLLFLSGCAPNQGKFYPQLDHIILLSAPAPIIGTRLRTRLTNLYGKQPVELARALEMQRAVEPRLRHGADLEIDTTAPVDRVVAMILRHVREP